MAGSLNKVTLIGNLGRDPEIRYTQDGRKIANFPLATTESWRDRQTNERRDRTEWHRIVVFNEKLAEVIEKYMKKGAKVYLEGQLQTRKWTDPNGQDKYTTEVTIPQFRGEIVMLDSKADRESGSTSEGFGDREPQNQGTSHAPSQPQKAEHDFSKDLDDDIPF